MPYLIAAVIVIVLLYLLVVYVILPISGFLLVASLVIGVAYAFFVSIYGFIKSLFEHINPYTTYVDLNVEIPPGVRRGYFFGPGFHQISITVKDAYSVLIDQAGKIKDFCDQHTGDKWYLDMWLWIFYGAAAVSIFVFGSVYVILFSIVLTGVILIGMCIFYVMFTILWCVDRIILALESIQSRCANCKRISVVPVFICPDCGAKHNKLTPGPYGIFRRKCTCSAPLPTTFINGRSKLEAVCPHCETELAASDARQYGIQLIGGTAAGKTTFLAAFWHIYLEQPKEQHEISRRKFPADAFSELEDWFQKGQSSSTEQFNANMYSVIHKRKDGTAYQLTIYDIAGEAFTDLSRSEQQQQQFKYCGGLIFVVDPTAKPQDINDAFVSFIHEFKGLKGKHSTKTSSIPVAVIISKADLYEAEIGLSRIDAKDVSNPAEISESDTQKRNDISKKFLVDRGYEGILNLLEGEFSNVQYYPVSAMGHEAIPGRPYEPWGVMEPVMWLLSHTDIRVGDGISNKVKRWFRRSVNVLVLSFFLAVVLGAIGGVAVYLSNTVPSLYYLVRPNVETLFDTGKYYYEANNFKNAVKYFTKAVKRNPDNADFRDWRGKANWELEKYETAIADFCEAARLAPSVVEYQYRLADAYSNMKDYDKVVAAYSQAIQLEPNNPEHYFNRAEANCEKNAYSAAIPDYAQAIRLDPNDPRFYNTRGSVYRKLEDYAKAVADHTEAIRLNPSDAKYHNNRGVAYHLSKNYPAAITNYTEAIRLAPDNARYRNNRGAVHSLNKNYVAAAADFREALRLEPGSAQYRTNLESAEEQQRKRQQRRR